MPVLAQPGVLLLDGHRAFLAPCGSTATFGRVSSAASLHGEGYGR